MPLNQPNYEFGTNPSSAEAGGVDTGTEAVPLLIQVVRPAGDTARDLNLATEAAFARGATSVLICRRGVTAGPDALTSMSSAIRRADRGSVLTAVVTLADHLGASVGARQFRGAYFWSAPQLRWDRENGYFHFADNERPTIESASCLAADVLLIPSSAWERVGPFDERFGTHLADLDWAWRAAQCGVPCLQVLSADFIGKDEPAGLRAATTFTESDSILLFARKHWPLRRWIAVFFLRLWRALVRRGARRRYSVRFWANYGTRVDVARRTYWYVSNLIGASTAQFRQELRAGLRTLRER